MEHKYLWQGDRLISEQYGTNTLEFLYDESGRTVGVSVNGAVFEYITNLQGDILKVVYGGTGDVWAEYTYDAWGRVLTATGNLAAANPLRYRGYFYDTETNLYYVHNRYYDPQLCRWINADSLASTGQGFLGCNMFAYCNNDPVILADNGGNNPLITISIIGLTTFITEIIEDKLASNAKKKYNEKSVNVYFEGEGEADEDKLNVRFYSLGDEKININISESLAINSVFEQKAVIDVIMQSSYYSFDKYGSREFMQAQWIAHNFTYYLAKSGKIGEKIAARVSGSTEPIISSRELDIRSTNNIDRLPHCVYAVLEWLIK